MNDRPARSRMRLSLATLLLIVAAAATVMAWHQTRSQRIAMRSRVETLRSLVRELRIEDRQQISVITRLPTLPDELIYDVYLPPGAAGRGHQLHLALEGIVGHGQVIDQFPDPVQSTLIEPGRHKIEVRHLDSDPRAQPGSSHRIEILLDDRVAMEASRPPAWQTSRSWSSNGAYSTSRSFDPNLPVLLLCRRFNRNVPTGSFSIGNNVPATGILLWIAPQQSDAESDNRADKP